MSGQNALILGATGATGKHLLRELLGSNVFTRIGEYGRRVTPTSELTGTEKLEQKTIDFEKLEESGLKEGNWDVIYVTLGTTRAAAGSAEAFEKIDREYVLNALRAAKSDGHKQRVVYLSSASANPKASVLYTKSKGLTEKGIAEIGFDDVIIFRPGFLAGAERTSDSRPLERIFGPIIGLASRFSSSLQIPTSTLAKSIRLAGELGSSGIPEGLKKTASWDGPSFTVLGNSDAIKLSEKQ
jgi:oxidoreductase